MIWVWVLLIVVLMGAVVVVAVGRGESMSEVYDDRPDTTVPMGRPLTADDVRDVRFTTAVRGYRMDEVDAFMSRLSADLLARETRDAAAATEPPGGSSGESGAHAGPPTSLVAEHLAAADSSAGSVGAPHSSGSPRHLPESPDGSAEPNDTSADATALSSKPPATPADPPDPAAPDHEGRSS